VNRALLLDLGNVVLRVDFRRTFDYWASAASVPTEQLHRRWQLDEAYELHEVGALEFEDYIAALSRRLMIELPMEEWRAGWNAVFAGAFQDVHARLPAVRQSMPLYLFTNTNATHQAAWSNLYEDTLRHFDALYVSSEIGHRKPNVAAFQHVADDMGYAPEQIVFVDDTEENVLGAKAAGMDARMVSSEADVVRILDELMSPGDRDS
jgi:HAD superfamily hydrolase (TIGR01549 family)